MLELDLELQSQSPKSKLTKVIFIVTSLKRNYLKISSDKYKSSKCQWIRIVLYSRNQNFHFDFTFVLYLFLIVLIPDMLAGLFDLLSLNLTGMQLFFVSDSFPNGMLVFVNTSLNN